MQIHDCSTIFSLKMEESNPRLMYHIRRLRAAFEKVFQFPSLQYS